MGLSALATIFLDVHSETCRDGSLFRDVCLCGWRLISSTEYIHTRLESLFSYKFQHRVIAYDLAQLLSLCACQSFHQSLRVRQVSILGLLAKDILRVALDIDLC